VLLDHLGGVAEGLSYVVVLQLGEGFEDLGAGHAVGDHADDGDHGDPHTPGCRGRSHLRRVDGDALERHQDGPPGLVGCRSG